MGELRELHELARNAANTTYYTPQELANRWGCAKDTIYTLLRLGKLQGFKLGRDWRISEEARLAYERDPDNQETAQYNYKQKPGRKSNRTARAVAARVV